MPFNPDIDKILADTSKKEFIAFTKWMLGQIPADLREQFIAKLVFPESLTRLSQSSAKSKMKPELLEKKVQEVISDLNMGGRCLESDYREEWLETQRGDQAFDFEDPEGLLADIKKALKLLIECAENQEFELGGKLLKTLLSLEIEVTGECDESPFSFWDLYGYDVIKNTGATAKKTVFPAILLTSYMNSGNTESRVQAFAGFEDLLTESRSIYPDEMLALNGGSIPDFDAFLASWIDCLVQIQKNQMEHWRMSLCAEELVREAYSRLAPEKAREYAIKYEKAYPDLCAQYLNNGLFTQEPGEMYQFCCKALESVASSRGRREIALYAADYALLLDKPDDVLDCRMEAFKASGDLVDYLRILHGLKEFTPDLRDRLDRILTQQHETFAKNSARDFPLWEGSRYSVCLLLQGRAAEALDIIGRDPFNFLPGMIFLTLLLLPDAAECAEGSSADHLVNRLSEEISFVSADFKRGTGRDNEKEMPRNAHGRIQPDRSGSFLWKALQKVRTVSKLSADNRELMMEKTEELITKYADTATSAGRRDLYYLCAAMADIYGSALKNTRAKSEYTARFIKRYARWRTLTAPLKQLKR